MASKPPFLPLWCTASPANMQAPSQALIESGYVPDSRPAAQTWNYQANLVGAWIAYLQESQATTVLASTLDPSVRLLGGGQWAWSLGSTTLSWSDTAFLAYPGAADAANSISAGSAVLPSGYVAYVVANEPFSTQCTTTNGSTTLTNVAYGDVVQVGWTASGPGIPANTTVTSVSSDGASVVLTSAATATAAGVTVNFAGSGSLSVSTALMASFTPSQNSVMLARATDTTCWVGVGSAQMRLHDGETKGLLEGGYLDVRRQPAGQALAALQFVYLAPSTSDGGRTAGAAYPADASGSNSRYSVLGVNITAHQSGELTQIVTSGLVGGFTGLTIGQAYYLDPAKPGGITATKPSAAPQWVVPVGTAISATQMVLNANAAADASQVPTNFAVQGTLSGNSVVSAQGFAANVDMGSIFIPANTNQQSGGKTVPLQLRRENFSAASSTGNSVKWWPTSRSGSVIGIQIYCNQQLTGPLAFEIDYSPISGQGSAVSAQLITGSTPSLAAYPGGAYVYAVAFAKGLYAFRANDLLCAKLGMSTAVANDAIFSIDITVEFSD